MTKERTKRKAEYVYIKRKKPKQKKPKQKKPKQNK